jgi:hypothetical protein
MKNTNYKLGDRMPIYTTTLMEGVGTPQERPIDGTTATSLTFKMTYATMLDGVEHVVKTTTGIASWVSRAAGTVRFDPGENDFDTLGVFKVEWVIVWPGNLPQTVPAFEHDTITIGT